MKAVFQYIVFEFDKAEEETAWLEVLELDRLEAEELERKRLEELKEAEGGGEVLSDSDPKSPTVNLTKDPAKINRENRDADSDDEPEHRGGLMSVVSGGATE